jgi:CDP-glycerol glycerophosphotransferase (TagB/SpsB family)
LIYRFFNNRFIQSHNFDIKNNYDCIIFSGEKDLGFNHINLWIDYFLQSDIKPIIYVRSKKLYDLCKEKYNNLNIPILYIKNKILTYYIIKKINSIKAIFYLSNTGNVINMVKIDYVKHIFLGHGDSDKTASAHKFFRIYDEIWVASEAHIDRFKNANFRSEEMIFKKIGRPNLKELILKVDKDWKIRLGNKINILYLSTWEGYFKEHNYTSVNIIIEVFEKLSNFEIDHFGVKLHPFLGIKNKNYKKTPNKLRDFFINKQYNYTIYPKEQPLNSFMLDYNIFICDISAVITEVLALNSPIFVYIPKNRDIKVAKSKFNYNDYTYTFSTVNEFMEKYDKVINGNDYLREKREEAMEYILGKSYMLNNTFVNLLNNIKFGSD